MFYTFCQSNPGGRYDETMPMYVIIQAVSAEDANKKAESVGVYFDGIAQGIDCSCCNDRWYRVEESDGTDTAQVYEQDAIDDGEKTKIYYFTPLEKAML